MDKAGSIKSLLLIPLSPHLFFKFILEVNDWKKLIPTSWMISVNIDLFIFASGFMSMVSGLVYLIAALMNIPWAGDPGDALGIITRNYLFSLFFAWFIRRSSF
jgi:hypothetical protein